MRAEGAGPRVTLILGLRILRFHPHPNDHSRQSNNNCTADPLSD